LTNLAPLINNPSLGEGDIVYIYPLIETRPNDPGLRQLRDKGVIVDLVFFEHEEYNPCRPQ
jgi:hypothetical protein